MSFNLSILTPDRSFCDLMVDEIVFSTTEGSIGILEGHEPMIATVFEGTIEILSQGSWRTAAVSQGFVEVTGKTAEFFLDTVEWADEIDAARAKEALERAEHRLSSQLNKIEYIRTCTAISRATARLKAVSKH